MMNNRLQKKVATNLGKLQISSLIKVRLQKGFCGDRLSDYLIEFFLAAIIIFSPLFYGSITILPLSIVETLSFTMFLFFILRALFLNQFSFLRISFLPFAIFIPLTTLQVIPFPQWLLSLLSPATLSLQKKFMVNSFTHAALSIYPEATLYLFIQLLSCLVVFFVVVNYLDSEKKCKRLIAVIILSGFIYSVYGIIMKINTAEGIYSTFTNRNHFAAYIQLIIPLALAGSLISRSSVKRVVLFFISSVMIVSLFYSWSRAGRVCFVFSLAIFFILLSIKKPLGRILLPVVILFLFLAIFAGIIGFSGLFNRLESLSDPFKAYSDRFMFFMDTLRVVGDFPFLGVGLGTFSEIIQKYKTTNFQISYIFSHNEPAQLLSEVGIIGFLLTSLFFMVILFDTFRAWLKRMNKFAVFVSIACFIGAASILFHSLFDFVFHVPANFILFFIILALGFRAAHTSNSFKLKVPEFTFNISKWFKIVLIGLFCALFIFIESVILGRCRAQLIFDDLKERRFSGNNLTLILDYKLAIKDINTAIALNPLNSAYFNKKGDLFADLASKDGLESELSVFEEFGTKEALLLSANQAYKRAVNINPTKADYHLRLGWSYNVLGQADLMRKEFNQALLLDPQNKSIKDYIESIPLNEKSI